MSVCVDRYADTVSCRLSLLLLLFGGFLAVVVLRVAVLW